MKALGIVRVSTSIQEMDSQKAELLDFIKLDGWSEEDIIIIEGKGASAIKLDELYLFNMDKAKEYISNGEIKCVYATMLDRIGRDEEVMMGFKKFLITHGTNLKIKTPSLTLLEKDGSVNNGMEIAFSLYCTMASQEMQVKKGRFKRAKKRNGAQGKYLGGGTLRYGYSVDENGFLIENEKEADVIRLIYRLYATGKYSLAKLEKEMKKRGYEGFHQTRLHRILITKAYIGGIEGELAPVKYPRLVSDETYETVNSILANNNLNADKNYKHCYFGSKLVYCGECGHAMVANASVYACHGRVIKECGKNSAYISTELMDGLLFMVAAEQHLLLLARNSALEAERLKNDISINLEKKNALEAAGEAVEGKIERAKNLYVKGLSNEKQLDKDIAKIRKEDEERKNNIISLDEKIESLKGQLAIVEGGMDYSDLLEAWDKILTLEEEKERREIVRLHIARVTVNKKSETYKTVEMQLVNGETKTFHVYFHAKVGKRLFIVENGREKQYVEFYVKREFK